MKQSSADEGGSAVREEYARLAPDYDRRWANYLRATIARTLDRMDPAPGEGVLEVGCGTGAFLAALHESRPELSLAGVDPVPEMLTRARRRLPEQSDLALAWAEKLPFPDGAFDWAVSCNTFHYIRHPRQALAEMHRVLAPGGRLVLTDWCGDYLGSRLMDRWLRLRKTAHHRLYRGEEMLELLEEAGLGRPRLERYKIDRLWGMMSLTAGKPS